MRWLVVAIGVGGLALSMGVMGVMGDVPGGTPRQGVSETTPARTAEDAPAAGAADTQFLTRIEAHIAAREYWASPSREGLQAPNRRHGLRSWFEPTGVRVHERSTPGSPMMVELRLAGLGRGEAWLPVRAGEVSHSQGRVEIRRDGLVEWFENTAEGLEQGFTLAERPATGSTGELVLELSLAGARASLRGDGVAFSTAVGRTLSYSKLAVMDAHGVSLTAHFELPSPDRIRVVVDDHGATYPVVIDPLLTETEDTLITALQGGSLGWSVASVGDVNGDGYDDLIVGAPFFDAGEAGEGAAFVFHGSAAGIADATPLSADGQIQSDQVSAELGSSVASAGDVNGDGFDDVIVGAARYDAGQTDEGAAFLLLGSAMGIGNRIPATSDALLEGNQASASFGASVASAGDVNGDGFADVIIGASRYDAGELDEGAAFIFLGSALGIANGAPANAQLEADQASDGFFRAPALGGSVASAGDVNGDGYDDVIVGASGYDAGQIDEGAAFVFLGSAAGIANGNPSTAHAQIESNSELSLLGTSVASAGDVNGDGFGDVIVGAPLFSADQSTEGAAFVFLGSAMGLVGNDPATAHAQFESNQERNGLQLFDSNFGHSVASAGDVNGDGYGDVMIGAPYYPIDGNGAAFVFLGSASGMTDGSPATAYAELVPAGEPGGFGTGPQVGRSVAAGDVNGDGYSDVFVGVPSYVTLGGIQSGAAVVYLGSATGIVGGNPPVADARLESDQLDSFLGFSVSSAGDVNGDGFGDVIVGAPVYDGGTAEEGAAFVFLGSATGLDDGGPATAHAQLESDQLGAYLGWVVSSAGDVNGDGFGDVIVSAPGYDAGQYNEGAAFVFHGSANGIADGNPATAHARIEGDQEQVELDSQGQAILSGIRAVASAGDVNGDGFGDVIVGASGYDDGEINEGAAFVFLGSTTGIADGNPSTAHAQLESDQVNGALGSSVASAGDVNGDGFGDLIVGAPGYVGGGAAFVFLGSATGIVDGTPTTAHVQLDMPGIFKLFMGFAVASAGDVNGDGYGDLIVGHPGSGISAFEGSAGVFLGSAVGIAYASPHAVFETDAIFSWMGAAVASAGDVNGDGFGDVIVGAPFYDTGTGTKGAAFVYLGSSTGFADGTPDTAAARLQSLGVEENLATNVASAGDVNGDGVGDLIVGAPSSDAALVFLGNDEGRPVRMQQRRGDGSGIPVEPGGGAYSSDGFEVELFATSPRGRERARLDVEVCASGVAFGSASCTSHSSPSWVDLGTSGVTLQTSIIGLNAETSYSWRARVLYTELSATQPGITPMPRPGVWRRLQGQARAGDIRTTVPEPTVGLGLLIGFAFVVSKAQRKRRGRVRR